MKCDNCGNDTKLLFNIKYESLSKNKPYRMDVCWICCAIFTTISNREDKK